MSWAMIGAAAISAVAADASQGDQPIGPAPATGGSIGGGGSSGPVGSSGPLSGQSAGSLLGPNSGTPDGGVTSALEEQPAVMSSAPMGGDVPDYFRKGSTPQAEPEEPEKENPFSKYFGNMNKNMDNPLMSAGVGAMGQVNPYLGYAGLLASGLFNSKASGT